MPSYTAPLRDVRFLLFELLNAEQEWAGLPGLEVDRATVDQMLDTAGRFASDVLFPLNQSGDREGCKLKDGQVFYPDQRMSRMEALKSYTINGAYAGFQTDAARWPNTAAFVERTLAHRAIADLLRFEDVQRSVEIKGRRQALLDAGAPLTAETLGEREPRRGMVRL